MKRRIICIGLCMFSISLLFGGCTGNAAPNESTPAIVELEEASPSESGEIEKEIIAPTVSPQPSASPTPRASVTQQPTPTATQSNNTDTNNGGGSKPTAATQSASNVSSQAPAPNTSSPTMPTPVPTADPHAGKTWYDDEYDDVWVVDEPAHTVEEVTTKVVERTYCFICDIDITGNIPGHGDYHFDRDEDYQYGGKLVEDKVVKQVAVPEKGHWEKKLVRKAGWY